MLVDMIEEERSRLMSAEAVLHCAALVMDDEATASAHCPPLHIVVELARDLIARSIDQLDSLHLRPMLKNIELHGSFKVEERTIEYLQ